MDRYSVKGMSCAACVARVEKAVRKVPGTEDVSVSLLTNSMTVTGTASPKEITAAVKKAGYGAKLLTANEDTGAAGVSSSRDEFRMLRKRFLFSLLFLLPLLFITTGKALFSVPLPAFLSDPLISGFTQAAVSLFILLLNIRFFRNGFRGLSRLSPNMDTLVSLGAGISYLYSLTVLLRAAFSGAALTDLYFESAAMILTLITLGKMLEAFSKGRTTDALELLRKLSPEEATVLRNGKEVRIPITELLYGDLFTVRPGEAFPADGTVTEGTSSVNEAALTGESLPVDKAPGDPVSAGTVNENGYLVCRAEKVGAETLLSGIIRTVQDAAASKAPIARLADRAAAVFVPVVMSLSLLTFLVWLLLRGDLSFALTRAIAVLVVSCPCALGLATPVSIMVGNGVGARHGILFKTAEALENTGRAKFAALDKTGTLTNGTPEVTDLVTDLSSTECRNEIPDELLISAVVLESRSEHPLSKAILRYAEKKSNILLRSAALLSELHDFTAVPGNGLCGKLGEKTLYGGKEEFIALHSEIPFRFSREAEALRAEGKTPLFFSEGEKLLGIIAVSDGLKTDARETVTALRQLSVEPVLLTGDNAQAARAVAKKTGIETCICNVLPGEKEKQIRLLKSQGNVIMVGDGINDAPALTAADTGIAIGAGTDIAIDAASVVLLKDSLSELPAAIRLSRATLRNIKENLFWAFFYNVLLIPLAAGVYLSFLPFTLSPMLSAACMSLSSFCVVMNALRLNLVRLYPKKTK